ncbi:40S ribosomal protein S27 [Tupaia chinensis]|uniref:40S ribosomal protein S27 n=1 Tax=Tupaia chinensis TaxID=246437 RepID=L9LBT7_TUPCH|nr:40S ribosomal protein S27 [Tupaia chinensis]
MPLAKDLLHPSPEEDKRTGKKQRLARSPASCSVAVQCPGCCRITPVFSMHKRWFRELSVPLSSASLWEEKRGLQKDVPSGGSSTKSILTQDEWETIPDRLHPSPEEDKRTGKKQHLARSPASCSVAVQCPGCCRITPVFSMHKRWFRELSVPLSSASLWEEKRGLQKDVPSGGSSTKSILTQDEWETIPMHVRQLGCTVAPHPAVPTLVHAPRNRQLRSITSPPVLTEAHPRTRTITPQPP